MSRQFHFENTQQKNFVYFSFISMRQWKYLLTYLLTHTRTHTHTQKQNKQLKISGKRRKKRPFHIKRNGLSKVNNPLENEWILYTKMIHRRNKNWREREGGESKTMSIESKRQSQYHKRIRNWAYRQHLWNRKEIEIRK